MVHHAGINKLPVCERGPPEDEKEIKPSAANGGHPYGYSFITKTGSIFHGAARADVFSASVRSRMSMSMLGYP